MNTSDSLPEDVLAALRANRKIEAIKRLRVQRNIGLRQAKEIVDNYLAARPAQLSGSPRAAGSGAGRLVVVAVLIAVFVVAYRFLT